MAGPSLAPTGFDAITGAWDRVEIRGTGGVALDKKWRDGPSTYFGLLSHGFPNLLMVAGPQSVSGSTNFPRAIEGGVDWVTSFLGHCVGRGITRFEARAEAEKEWVEEVIRCHERLLARRSRGWFTGYNSNVAGHGEGSVRYVAYFGGAPKYKSPRTRPTPDTAASSWAERGTASHGSNARRRSARPRPKAPLGPVRAAWPGEGHRGDPRMAHDCDAPPVARRTRELHDRVSRGRSVAA